MFSSGLLTYRDTPENILGELIKKFQNNYQISIGFNQEVTQEEIDVEKSIRQLAQTNNIQTKEFWTSTLYHPDDLPYNNPKAYIIIFLFIIKNIIFFLLSIRFPDVYTHLRVALEKQGVRVRNLIEIPNNFKPLPNEYVISSIPNLSDFGYSSIELIYYFDLSTLLFR